MLASCRSTSNGGELRGSTGETVENLELWDMVSIPEMHASEIGAERSRTLWF